MTSKRFSLKQGIVVALGIALVLASVPSSLQLFYLPLLYERSEKGLDVERQWSIAARAVDLLSPVLQIESFGKRVFSSGSHGFMRSWQYRLPWIVMYLVNTLSWWCIVLLLWLATRRVRSAVTRRLGARGQ